MLALDCSASSDRKTLTKAGSLSPGVIPADLNGSHTSPYLSPGNLLQDGFNLFGDDNEPPEKTESAGGVENDDELILSLSEAAS